MGHLHDDLMAPVELAEPAAQADTFRRLMDADVERDRLEDELADRRADYHDADACRALEAMRAGHRVRKMRR